MTAFNAPPRGGMPGAVADLLDALRASLANGRPELRATALYPLRAPGLRAAMLLNPRLTDRINERLASQKVWRLPTTIEPFAEAENVIHVLTNGPQNLSLGIGLAWHGNTLSHLLMRGGVQGLKDLDPTLLRRALALRNAEVPARTTMPSLSELVRDGELCLMAWTDELPACISTTIQAVLTSDPEFLELHPIGPRNGQVAAQVASAWLTADRKAGS